MMVMGDRLSMGGFPVFCRPGLSSQFRGWIPRADDNVLNGFVDRWIGDMR